MQNGGQLIPSRPCAQHRREIDRLILTDVEIEIAENVVEMIAHEPRRALGFAVPERAHEGDRPAGTEGFVSIEAVNDRITVPHPLFVGAIVSTAPVGPRRFADNPAAIVHSGAQICGWDRMRHGTEPTEIAFRTII
jgi:hypothetical protein